MQADEFYEQWKEALRFLGSGWANKQDVIMTIEDGQLIMRCGNNEVRMKLNGDV